MMSEDNTLEKKASDFPFHLIFICIFIGTTVVMTILRILIGFLDFSLFIELAKDIDYRILMEGMDNGLINFYDPITISAYPPYYLWFWYIMWFPMYIIPIPIGVYIWDIIRILLCSIVVIEASKVFDNKLDLLIFYILCTFSFFLDAFFNNVNSIILILLFFSYKSIDDERMWLSGILFALATFKINSIIFLPVILITRKIKLKELIYYLVPLALLCIPYAIFPDYFFKMVNNWTHGGEQIQSTNALVRIMTTMDDVIWKALQPSHLMFLGLMLIVFLENIKDDLWRKRYRIILLTILIVYNARLIFIMPEYTGT